VPSRFLASAFVAGPGLMILTFQIIRRVTRYYIGDQPIFTLRMIMTVAMIINMFLLGCELFTEFYSPTMHAAAIQSRKVTRRVSRRQSRSTKWAPAICFHRTFCDWHVICNCADEGRRGPFLPIEGARDAQD